MYGLSDGSSNGRRSGWFRSVNTMDGNNLVICGSGLSLLYYAFNKRRFEWYEIYGMYGGCDIIVGEVMVPTTAYHGAVSYVLQ